MRYFRLIPLCIYALFLGLFVIAGTAYYGLLYLVHGVYGVPWWILLTASAIICVIELFIMNRCNAKRNEKDNNPLEPSA
jgi:hypothetical protein